MDAIADGGLSATGKARAKEEGGGVSDIRVRPILFSAPMVRALLEGRKTQTRRAVKVRAKFAAPNEESKATAKVPCPYGKPGDRLWVRESFQPLLAEDVEWKDADYETGEGYAVNYVATGGVQEFYDFSRDESFSDRVTPSIFMPRWASRLTLEITEVRVQRLQEISTEDAMAEGIVQTWGDFGGNPPDWALDSISAKFGAPGSHLYDNRSSIRNYEMLWNFINGAGSWDANPWVWALTFKVLEP
jgi:hypothetical protein